MNDDEIRLECLKLAVHLGANHMLLPDQVISAARDMYKFVSGEVSGVAESNNEGE